MSIMPITGDKEEHTGGSKESALFFGTIAKNQLYHKISEMPLVKQGEATLAGNSKYKYILLGQIQAALPVAMAPNFSHWQNFTIEKAPRSDVIECDVMVGYKNQETLVKKVFWPIDVMVTNRLDWADEVEGEKLSYIWRGTSIVPAWVELTSKSNITQSVGSVVTYSRRYSMGTFFNIVGAEKDDDAASVSWGAEDDNHYKYKKPPNIRNSPPADGDFTL